ncbi:general secretion pathway protein GspK [Gemmatimonadota bacterium]
MRASSSMRAVGRPHPACTRRRRPRAAGCPRDQEGGFVLIAVLWLLVALGTVALHAGLEMRTERLAVANVLDEARARQTAVAGAEYARSHLTAALLDRADELRAQSARSDPRQGQSQTQSIQRIFQSVAPADDPWRDPQGLVISQMRFGDARFDVLLRDAQAALNVNATDVEMLTNFFAQGLGIDFAQADRLAQAIADWRDEDDIPRVGGGEQEEYLRSAMVMLPPNRLLTELDELRYVLGMTPEIFEAALPHLTLQNSGRININAAPEPVLLALPGMTPATALEIVRLRESGVYPSGTRELFQLLPGGLSGPLQGGGRRFSSRVTYRTDEVEILSEGWLEGSLIAARVRDVVIRSNSGALVTSREFY